MDPFSSSLKDRLNQLDEHEQIIEKKYLKMQTKRNRYGGNREKG